MVNRPKDKGTFAESALVDYLRENGWPRAERRTLAGSQDKGDIANVWGVAIEVKYTSGRIEMGPWLAEAGIERIRAGADHALLVVKPAGLGAKKIGRWLAAMVHADFEVLREKIPRRNPLNFPTPQEVFVRSGPPTAFTAATMRNQLAVGLGPGMLLENEILALTLRPPNAKDKPDTWYRVMCLDHAVRLFHAAGYKDDGEDGR